MILLNSTKLSGNAPKFLYHTMHGNRHIVADLLQFPFESIETRNKQHTIVPAFVRLVTLFQQ